MIDAAGPALELRGVTKSFGSTVAARDVHLAVAPGEMVALVGPSGCGKSTLLRLVAGLHRADAGTIELSGRTVDDGRRALAPEQRRVGLVFQEHALFPHLSVAKNVGFGIRDDKTRARTVPAMLELVGLADHGGRYPHELSGGERQRVALARALAPGPALMLLDEPFASLDPNLRVRLRQDIIAILRTAGAAVVFVTHDQGEALAVGERVAVMHRGSLVQLDTPQQVFGAPADRFVASFMGEAEFLDATDAAALGVRGGPIPERGTLMVRPGDVVLTVDDGAEAEVCAAEFRGATWSYTVRLAHGTHVHAIRSYLDPVPIGTRVAVSLAAGCRPVLLEDTDDEGVDGADGGAAGAAAART